MNDIVFAGTPCEVGEHKHKGWQIICAQSRGDMYAEGCRIAYNRGDVIVVPRRVGHTDAVGLSVFIENALISLSRACLVSGRGAEELSWACGCAERYFCENPPEKEVVLDGLGQLICSLIAAYCTVNALSPSVKIVMSEIDKGVSDVTFSLENAIRALPLNYDYVRKLFKKETGQTPLEYLTARRMSLARRILLWGLTNRYTNYTVAQTAEMCGYAEPLYFSRVFKKYYGVSPSEYAAANRQAQMPD